MSLDAFLASPEAEALADVPADARAQIATQLDAALADVGKPLEKLRAPDVHGWLLHAVPERFAGRDPLAKHVAPVVMAWIAFLERRDGRELAALRTACEATLPEAEDLLVHGRAHHHHHHDAPAPFVREAPKVGRNDPCPCGSGKKFKKCHGS